MAVTYYLDAVDSDIGSGANWANDLVDVAPGATTLTSSIANSAVENDYGYTEAGVPGVDGGSGSQSYRVDVVIGTGDAAVSLVVTVARVNSAGLFQQGDVQVGGSQAASAGTKTFGPTNVDLGTFNAGDRLRVRFQWTNSNAHGGDEVIIQTIGAAGTTVTAPWSAGTTHETASWQSSYVTNDHATAAWQSSYVARARTAASWQTSYTVAAGGGTGEVTFESIGSTTYAGRTNTTIPAPAGIQDGDLLLLWMITAGTGTPPTPTPPAGFAAVPGTFPISDTDGSFVVHARAYYKVASGESGNYTVTHTITNSQGLMLRLSGADTGDLFGPDASDNTNTLEGSNDTVFSGVTTLVDNTFLVLLAWDWAATTNDLTPPAGFTERFDQTLSYVATGAQATAGATGDFTMANNADDGQPWGATIIGIQPAAGGGGTHETVAWQSSYVVDEHAGQAWQSSYVARARASTAWQSSYVAAARATAGWQSSYTVDEHTAASWQSSYVARSRDATGWQSSYVARARATDAWTSSYGVALTHTAQGWQSLYRVEHGGMQGALCTAEALLDSIATGAHWDYSSVAANRDYLLDLWQQLGVRHCRTVLWDPDEQTNKSGPLLAALDGLRDIGVQFVVLADHRYWWEETPGSTAMSPAERMALADDRGYQIVAFEGLNEPDNAGVNPGIPAGYQTDWPTHAIYELQQIELARDAHPVYRGLPILSSALVNAGAPALLGDVSAWATVVNMHPYTGNRVPRLQWLQDEFARYTPENLPATAATWITEAGASTADPAAGGAWPTITEQEQAILTLEVLFASALEEIKRTYLYELVDTVESPNGFGFLRENLTKKPSYNALQRLTGMLDGGPTVAAPASFTVQAAPASLRTLDIHRADGKHLVALWREEDLGTTPVNVTFVAHGQTSGTEHDLVAGTADPVALPATVALGDTPVVMEIESTPPYAPQSPDEIAGLRLWLKADAIAGLSDNETVGQWDDESLNNFHAVQAVEASKPTYQTAEVNGLPVVRFDGTDDSLACPSSFAFKQVILVVKNAAATFDNFDGVVTHIDAGLPLDDDLVLVGAGSGTTRFFDSSNQTTVYHADTASHTEADMQAPMQQFGIVSISRDAGWNLRPQFGKDRDQVTRWFAGDIAEVIVYDQVLSDTDRQAVETYLNQKYDLGLTTRARQVWGSTYTVEVAAAQWASSYTVRGHRATDWSSSYTAAARVQASWQSSYAAGDHRTAAWQSSYAVQALGAGSGSWQSSYTVKGRQAEGWASGYTVRAHVGQAWSTGYTAVGHTGASWQSSYTVEGAGSAAWQTSYTVRARQQAGWGSSWRTLAHIGATWQTGYTVAGRQTAGWSSSYDVVAFGQGSGSWASSYVCRARATAAWQTGYTTSARAQAAWASGYVANGRVGAAWQSSYDVVSFTSGGASWASSYTVSGHTAAAWQSSYVARARQAHAWQSGYVARLRVPAAWTSSYTARARGTVTWTTGYGVAGHQAEQWSTGWAVTVRTPAAWQSGWTTRTPAAADWSSSYAIDHRAGAQWATGYAVNANPTVSWQSSYFVSSSEPILTSPDEPGLTAPGEPTLTTPPEPLI